MRMEIHCQSKIKPSEKYLGEDEFVELIFSCLRWSGANGAGGMLWKQIFRSSLLDDVRLLDDVQAVEDELFCLKVAAKSNAFFVFQRDYTNIECVAIL